MKASEHLLEQIHPPRINILGCNLLPLSLGHLYTLRKLGIDDGRIDSAEKCAMAVLVLSHGHAELTRKLNSYWFGFVLRFWSWRVMRWLRDPHRLLSTIRALEKYIEFQTRMPDTSENDGTIKLKSEVPFVQHIRTSLISRLGYKPETVYETPFVQAVWDYLCLQERDGVIGIRDGIDGSSVDERQAEADRYHAQLMAEEAARSGT